MERGPRRKWLFFSMSCFKFKNLSKNITYNAIFIKKNSNIRDFLAIKNPSNSFQMELELVGHEFIFFDTVYPLRTGWFILFTRL